MDFIGLAQNLGITAACLAALGLAVWRALTFIGVRIIEPLARRHILFLDELSLAVKMLAQSSQTITEEHKKLREEFSEKLDSLAEEIRRIKGQP